nr:MAG TPA: chromosome partition protein [Bacteriophage sp.]
MITLSNFKSYPDKYPWDFSPREIDINFVFWARLH